MEATLATATRKVEAIYYAEEFAGIRIDGKAYSTFRHGSTRSLVRVGRELMKLGFQSTYEAKLFTEKLADHPNFWPLTGFGRVAGHKSSKFGWVTQQILPLKRALREYSWDEWKAGFDVITKVASKFHLTDFDLWSDDDGGVCVHNWTIYRDTPVIYDFGS